MVERLLTTLLLLGVFNILLCDTRFGCGVVGVLAFFGDVFSCASRNKKIKPF